MIIAEREDLIVSRASGIVKKMALTRAGRAELRNEARFLRALAGSGFVPELKAQAPGWLVMEDIGDGEPIRDRRVFLQNCLQLLFEFRRRGIRHGDLTSRNLVIRDDVPIAIDFGESRFADDGRSSKRPGPDVYWLWQAVQELIS